MIQVNQFELITILDISVKIAIFKRQYIKQNQSKSNEFNFRQK